MLQSCPDQLGACRFGGAIGALRDRGRGRGREGEGFRARIRTTTIAVEPAHGIDMEPSVPARCQKMLEWRKDLAKLGESDAVHAGRAARRSATRSPPNRHTAFTRISRSSLVVR